MSTAGPGWGDTARTQEAPVLLEGAGLANVAGRERPEDLHRPAVALVPAHRRLDRARSGRSMLLTVSDAGDGAGTWTVSLAPQAQTAGVTIDVPGTVDARARRRRRGSRRRARRRRRRRPARTTASSSSRGTASSAVSRTPSSSSARRCATRRRSQLKKLQTGDTAVGHEPRVVVLLPGGAVRAAADLHRPHDERGRRRASLLHRHQRADRELRRLGARRRRPAR